MSFKDAYYEYHQIMLDLKDKENSFITEYETYYDKVKW